MKRILKILIVGGISLVAGICGGASGIWIGGGIEESPSQGGQYRWTDGGVKLTESENRWSNGGIHRWRE